MKITLFMCAGAIYVATGKESIREMNGIGRLMPVTMGAFTLGAAGLVGLPPVCGLLSKWYLCLGAFSSGEMIFLFVFLASALLDAAYFFPIIYNAYFRTDSREIVRVAEAPLLMTAPLAVSALCAVALCFAPGAVFRFFNLADLLVTTIF
jgi:multicomponent Na+:H+ antiporter subunit D